MPTVSLQTFYPAGIDIRRNIPIIPARYVIVSSSKQGRNLIVGNAVPPMLAGVIAHELKHYIEEE